MLRTIVRRLRSFGRRSLDGEIQRELASHLAMEIEHRRRGGMSEEEARRTALRDFGGLERIREEVRDVRGMTFRDALAQDVRFGLRTLRRAPGYTVATISILALGIGANTAVFSVISGVLLKPLPFRDGEELVLVQHRALTSRVEDAGVSIPELADYRTRLQSIRDLVEHHSMSFTLLNQGEPDRINAGVVSANFFDMLGVSPLHGRTFVDADDDLGADAVLVLSHAYWTQKFGADPDVVGRVLQMNNRPHTVVGVLPDYPQYPRDLDVYMPTSACPFRAQAQRDLPLGHRSFTGLRVFGRLAPGRTVQDATAEIATVAPTFEQAYREDHARTRSLGFTGHARSLQESLVSDARPMLGILLGTTVLVLIIGAANVANLALARTVRRSRELAVRTALGAGRQRLVRLLVTESLLLAGVGGALGVALAWVSLDLLTQFVGRFTTRTGQIEIDAGVLAFTLIVSLAAGVVFGAVPALSIRRELTPAMREGGAQTGDGRLRRALRAGLVVAQVAVSFVLLVGAAMLLESLYRLYAVPLGFQTDRVMTASIFGNFTRMSDPAEAIRIQSEILARLRASSGVTSAAVTNAVPQASIAPAERPIRLEGRPPDERRRLEANISVATDDYFRTLGVPLLAGRDFNSGDTASSAPVAIISASMAKLWGDSSPLGRRFAIDGPAEPRWITVVGIAGDFRLYSVDREIEAQYYVPLTQASGGGRILVSSERPPSTLIPMIKAAVHGVDPQIPVEELRTLDELRRTRLATPRVTTALLTIFAAVALLVTLAGLAGVVGTSVSQRTREFGLRMALGASRASVLGLVLRQGVILVTAGAVIGVAGAYWAGTFITRYLYNTTATDPVAYLTVAGVFLLSALVATLGPARRATTIDPLTALRAE